MEDELWTPRLTLKVRRVFKKLSGVLYPLPRVPDLFPDGGWGQYELVYCVSEKQKFLLQWEQKGQWDQPILF